MAATDHAQAVKKDTREFIMTATLQLLQKEKLSTLTVSQVCQRAGVSRMAFYRNFFDLQQVLHDFYQPKIAAEFEVVRSQADVMKSLHYERFFERFGDDFILAEKAEYEPIIWKIFVDEIKAFYADVADDYWVTFMAAGVYAIWRQWLLDGKTRPIAEVDEMIRKIVG